MKPLLNILVGLTVFVLFEGCNYVTYTPRSKRNIRREQPSLLLLERIVDFRLEQNSWPVSKEDFISKGMRYYEVMRNFPYAAITFKTIDSNTMNFYFSGHIKDAENYNQSQKVDLNAYSGTVKFYKENDKFIWRLKMD